VRTVHEAQGASPDACELVVEALSDRRWHSSAELADETDLLPIAVRLACRELARRDVVRRGSVGPCTGCWQIASVIVEPSSIP
jgi:hypothetical protein